MRRAIFYLLVLAVGTAVLPPVLADLFDWGPGPHLVPRRGKVIPIGNGRSLHVVEFAGSGAAGSITPSAPAIVLVHALPGTAADWADVPRRLAAGGTRVLAYDRVGFGYSSREPEGTNRHTYAANAGDLLALLDAYGLEQATLVGWSYGGAVVQTLVERAPERVSHVVLVGAVGPAVPRFAPEPWSAEAAFDSPLGGALFRWITSIPPLASRLTRDGLAEAFSNSHDIPDGWTEYTQAALSLPGTFEATVLETQRANPILLRPEAITVPTLVIHGTDDRRVPYDVGKDLHARIASSKLETVFDGSHMLPVTHPDLVAEAVARLVGGGFILEEPE